jgi:hypothetical protein
MNLLKLTTAKGNLDVTTLRNFSLFALSMVFVAMALLGGSTAQANNGPVILPPSVLNAKSVYVDNETTDAQLQTEIYGELLRWGRFQIADNLQKADLIIRVSNGNTVKFVEGNQSSEPEVKPASAKVQPSEEPIPVGYTRITLLDVKSGGTIWNGLKKVSGAPGNWHLLDGVRDLIERAHNSR